MVYSMEHMDEKIISMLYKTEKAKVDDGKEEQKPLWQYDLQQAEFTIDGERITFTRRSLSEGA